MIPRNLDVNLRTFVMQNYLTMSPHRRWDNGMYVIGHVHMMMQKTHRSSKYAGLTYIDTMPLEELRDIAQDPSWTKAVFVRNPFSRTLSGYLEKLINHKPPEFNRLPVCNKLNKTTVTVGVTNATEKTSTVLRYPMFNRGLTIVVSTVLIHNITEGLALTATHTNCFVYGSLCICVTKNKSVIKIVR